MYNFEFSDIPNFGFSKKSDFKLQDLISLTCLVRRAFNIAYDQERPNLQHDIINFKLDNMDYKPNSVDGMKETDGLYQYSYHLGLKASKILLDPAEKMKCIIANKKPDEKLPSGVIIYNENIDSKGKHYIYVHFVAAKHMHQKIGTGLLRSLLLTYPVGTDFFLDVRKMNMNARKAYEKIGFTIVNSPEKQHHCDPALFHIMNVISGEAMIENLRETLSENTVEKNFQHPKKCS